MATERLSWRREGLICLLLALTTVSVYWPVRHFEFLNFDDGAYVTANPHVFRGLSQKSFAWAFNNLEAANWHPMTWLSHMLDCQLFGFRPGLHHLTNLILHTGSTLVLFGLLRRLTGSAFRSAMVAALFALHPLHVESVAWVAERKDVLSTLFGLLALWAYTRYAQQAAAGSPEPGGAVDQPPSRVLSARTVNASKAWYALALTFFVLGLMSKPMLVTLPFVMLLLDFWPLRRLRGSAIRALALEKLPFFLFSAADCVVTAIAQELGHAMVAGAALSFSSRLINAALAYAGYLRKMIWPVDLAAFYPYRHVLAPREVLVALLVLALVSTAVVALRRRAPYLVVGWLWYLGMLVPVIGLMQVGAQGMADRYTYLPLVGIFLMWVWGTAEMIAGLRHRIAISAISSALILAGCVVATWRQEQHWHDSEALFRRDLQLFPDGNVMGHYCLGRALFERGADGEAKAHFDELLRLLPGFVPGHVSLGNCLSRQGQFAEALIHYTEAIRLEPKNPEAYKCLGASLAAQMKLDEAETNYLTAIRYKPDYAEAYMRLGTAEMAKGKAEEAIKYLTAAVAIHPDYAEAQYYLARALEDHKRFDEAAFHFNAAIKANPGYAVALNDLAWMLSTEVASNPARAAEAIGLAKRACELTHYKHPPYLETLGIAYSEAGRFPEAIEATEKAIAAAELDGQREAAAQMRKRLALYRSGRSYSGDTNRSNGRTP
jgi:protein O-mannosyl-transferase